MRSVFVTPRRSTRRFSGYIWFARTFHLHWPLTWLFNHAETGAWQSRRRFAFAVWWEGKRLKIKSLREDKVLQSCSWQRVNRTSGPVSCSAIRLLQAREPLRGRRPLPGRPLRKLWTESTYIETGKRVCSQIQRTRTPFDLSSARIL